MDRSPRQRQATPLALFLSSLTYFYNSFNDGLGSETMPFAGRIGGRATTVMVETNYGVLRGLKEYSRIGRSYYSFKGIPYASPPVGDLRFEPPVLPQNWTGVKDATRFGAQCLQMNIITRMSIVGNEDCLFLNVYSHNPRQMGKNQSPRFDHLHPVIVFIHGGIFMSGSANIYRPKYFMDEDVVLVTLNYRLASFGFLNTEDGVVKGNMGLKDQTMALRWVKDNILHFGGDATRVTLMGESAGGAAVHFHMLSPLSKGLFHRAISMSGTSLSPWALVENARSQALEYATDLNCPIDNTSIMVQCLKSLDSHAITRIHFRYINALANNKRSLYGPTVESVVDKNTFLSESPIQLVKSARVNNVPWLTGVNSEEGLVYLIPIIRNATMNALVNSQWDTFAEKIINLRGGEATPKLLQDIRHFYLNNSDISLATLKKSADMISDRAFFLDNHDAVILHSQVNKVFPYYYTYNGSYAMAKLLFVKSSLPFRLPDRYDFTVGTLTSWFTEYVLHIREPNYFGVGHSDEIPLFFNTPFIRREVVPEDEDYVFSRMIIGLWVSFAETGVPDTRAAHVPEWKPVDRMNMRLGDRAISRYRLNSSPGMDEEPFFQRLWTFWKARNITYF